jgi:hypothetical protein
MTKTVTNSDSPSQSKSKEINNNTNSTQSLPKKHQQTVRFTDHKNGKSKLRSTVAIGDSDDSIVSDTNYSPDDTQQEKDSQHVGMKNLNEFGF